MKLCDEITTECPTHVGGEFVDRYKFWSDPPDEPSPRFAGWLDRTLNGQHGRTGGGYDEDAEHMGVYLWESLNPLFVAEDRIAHQWHDLTEIRSWLERHGLPTVWMDGVVLRHHP